MVRFLAGTADRENPKRAFFAVLTPLLLLVAASCGGGATGGGSAEGPAPGAGEEVASAVELEPPSLGDESAPVVLVEYADYQ